MQLLRNPLVEDRNKLYWGSGVGLVPEDLSLDERLK